MSWLWIGIAALVAALGIVRRAGVPRARSGPRVDDDAVRRIVETGRLAAPDAEEPLDMDEAARAEEAFFGESWDEPEELRP